MHFRQHRQLKGFVTVTWLAVAAIAATALPVCQLSLCHTEKASASPVAQATPITSQSMPCHSQVPSPADNQRQNSNGNHGEPKAPGPECGHCIAQLLYNGTTAKSGGAMGHGPHLAGPVLVQSASWQLQPLNLATKPVVHLASFGADPAAVLSIIRPGPPFTNKATASYFQRPSLQTLHSIWII